MSALDGGPLKLNITHHLSNQTRAPTVTASHQVMVTVDGQWVSESQGLAETGEFKPYFHNLSKLFSLFIETW